MGIKFRILQENLQKALETVGPAAGRTNINALYGVLLTAKGSTLTLSATDLELHIEAKAAAAIIEDGQALVKYQTLHNQITSLPSEPVDIELVEAHTDEIEDAYGQILSVSCAYANARLYCEDHRAFPSLPANDQHTKVSLPTGTLARAMRMVSYCISTEDPRPALTALALFVKPTAGTISTLAADGYRLAKMEVPCDITGEDDVDICVPRHSAREIERALSRNPGTVSVTINSAGTHARFALAGDSIVINTQLLRENTPNYDHVIPQGPMSRNLTINSASLKAGMNSVAGISRLGDNVTRMYPKDPNDDFKQGSLVFTANANSEFSRNVIPVEASSPPDAPLNYTAINHRFLADFMAAIGNESPIEMGIDDYESSMRLTNADGTYVYVAMPMTTTWPNPHTPKGFDDQPEDDLKNQGLQDDGDGSDSDSGDDSASEQDDTDQTES